MIDMGSIQAAIGSLKTAGDIAKGFMQLKTTAEIQSKVIELQSEILAAQSGALAAQSDQSSLLEEIRQLKARMAEIEGWENEAKRYKLTDYGAGTFAYQLKTGMENGEPPHSLCPNCFQNRKKSILQTMGNPKDTDSRRLMMCPACDGRFPLGKVAAGNFAL